MITTKRYISCLIAAIMILTMLSGFGVSAAEAPEDWVLGDFTVEGGADSWSAQSGYSHKDKIVGEVTRPGKSLALKWDDHGTYNAPSDAEAAGAVKNSRLQAAKVTDDGLGLGKVLEYDYVVIWIYSDVANGQETNVLITDTTTNKYHQAVFTANWTGWKPVVIDISGVSLAQFDKDGVVAAETDDWQFNMQSSGWSKRPLKDTLFYVDSVYLTNTDPTAIEPQTEAVTSEIKDGMRDITPDTKTFEITTNSLLKFEKDYYSKFISVSRDGAALVNGTDYSVYHELNKIYVSFANKLTDGSTYNVTLAAGAAFGDGTTVAEDYSVDFMANEIEFTYGEYSFEDENGAIIALPASGQVTVSLPVTNNTGAAQSGTLFVGVYDKTTNQMKKLGIGEAKSVNAGESYTYTASVTAASYENCYVRAFLWKDSDSMYSFGEYGEI